MFDAFSRGALSVATMGLSAYYKSIRGKLGHDLILAPGVCALIFNDHGEILLQRRSDSGRWAVIGGMLDPGEEPADAIVREVQEETSLRVTPERISGVYSTPVIEYPNGDKAQFIITAFVCSALHGDPKVNDDESIEVRYFPTEALPELSAAHRLRVEHAIQNQPSAFYEFRG